MAVASTPQNRAIQCRQFANGLVLLAEPSREVQSAAFTLLIPCGYSVDPADRLGLASLLCDMAFRGAGERDSRTLVNDLEILGVERGESVGAAHTGFSGATVAENLDDALALYADVVLRPLLPPDQLESAQAVCLQEIRGVEDEPSHKLMEELRRRTYPEPWGRSSHGDEPGVASSTVDDVRTLWRRRFQPQGAILGVAGNVEWNRLVDRVEALFADWQPGDACQPADQPPVKTSPHNEFASNQCHIGIAFPTVPYSHPQYLQAWAAIGVLSDGMSSRLFTEVREKRGLCYSVHASLQTQLTRARVLCYAGTTAERAQETLDVTFHELVRLGKGVEQDELDRLKARIKSGLIMQQESTSARSGAIARDWYHLHRVRTLDELSREIDQLTADTINAYLAEHPPQEFTFATLGPQPLTIPTTAD
jgi:predicted Zn-dependent peptidase